MPNAESSEEADAMIQILQIQNFKSIKQLKLACQRINVLIGEPNAGKSNILEAIGLFSCARYYRYGGTNEFVRFEGVSNLFYDELLDEPIRIRAGDFVFALEFKGGNFTGEIRDRRSNEQAGHCSGDYNALYFGGGSEKELSAFKLYRFAVQSQFPHMESEFLLPPSGKNLMSLMQTNKELRRASNKLFANFGLELNLRPQESKIEVLKRLEGITVSYPYSLSSDTLQRVVFYMFAILSNSNSVLIFEEPESHAFPYYTKYLAENIALDSKGNQYFIATHNPYLLRPLLEKAPKDEVAVFITYFEDYQTKVRPLSADEKEEIMEVDVFFELDRFLERK